MNWQSSIHLLNFPSAIVHIDGDAFFSSCEQAGKPELKGKPVITGKERGIVASLSYEAKALGVKRGMTLLEVKKVCPQAIILPSDYETYSLYSKRMFEVMRRFTSDVEEYSIDEGFADITGLRRPLNNSYQGIAGKMKETLDRELGFTVSVGLAPSKVLAKVASKWKKPNGLTCIRGRDIKEYLAKVKVEDLWGVGPNTARYLNKFGITTALEFIQKDFDWVRANFTKPHEEMWRELNGEAVYKVEKDLKTNYASISKTKTFTPASSDKDFVFSQLTKNLENACIKLRRHNLVAGKIVLFIKTQEFRFRAEEAKLSRLTAYPTEIISLIESLYQKIFNPASKYRATGIILTDIQENKNIQKTLFEEPTRLEKSKRIYDAVDALSRQFGKHTVYLGSSLEANKYSQHLGERGDAPERKKIVLRGEKGRKKLGLPVWDVRV